MGVAVDVTGRHREAAFVGEGSASAVRATFVGAQADLFAGCICRSAYCIAATVKLINDIQLFTVVAFVSNVACRSGSGSHGNTGGQNSYDSGR